MHLILKLSFCIFYWSEQYRNRWWWGIMKILVFWARADLLLLLSRFNRVWLCETPWTAAHQAPPSTGLSRREDWSGVTLVYRISKSSGESTSDCTNLPLFLGKCAKTEMWIEKERTLHCKYSNLNIWRKRLSKWNLGLKQLCGNYFLSTAVSLYAPQIQENTHM